MMAEPQPLRVDMHALSKQPASLADIQALTQITEGLEQSIEKVRESAITPEQISHAVQSGIVAGIGQLIRDEKTINEFWKSGYDQLTVRAHNNATQWIGKRILTAISAGVFIAVLVWSVKNGHIK